jgi:hypothetical protein
MKAQRRHELKQNTLAHSIAQLPQATKQHRSMIVLAIVAGVLAFILVRQRMSAGNDAAAGAMLLLGQSDEELAILNQLGGFEAPTDPDQAIKQRNDAFTNAIKTADGAIESIGNKDPHIAARGILNKADTNFTMANMPPVPGATTRASLRPDQTPDQLLSAAETLYSQVLSKYPDDMLSVASAHFGLAAVAEDRAVSDPSNWDKAAQNYQAVLDGSATAAFKSLATQRLANLPNLKKPMISNLTAPSTQPSTEPATIGATTMPTTNPSAMNVSPATQPIIVPAIP